MDRILFTEAFQEVYQRVPRHCIRVRHVFHEREMVIVLRVNDFSFEPLLHQFLSVADAHALELHGFFASEDHDNSWLWRFVIE